MAIGYPPYQPYNPPYQPQGFQGINTYPQPQNQPQGQQQAPTGFLCRPVASKEEAVAAQIDFMGPGTIMPDLGHGVIYLKRFNQNTGAADFFQFSLQPTPKEEPQEFVSMSAFLELKKQVDTVLNEWNGKAVIGNDANE